jgi:hypothetical protein
MNRVTLRSIVTVTVCALALLIQARTVPRATAFSDQPPAKRTGAPGENTCNTCHDGALNGGGGTLAITGVPDHYMPGQNYVIAVSIAQTGKTRWGFELTALRNSNGSAAGAITNTTLFTTVQTSAGVPYLSQTTLNAGNDGTFAGAPNGPITWFFQWTAPAGGTGAVTFYACGVAADNSGDADNGDDVYTVSAGSLEGASTDVEGTTWGKIKMIYR